jgi:hypothetical protein
VNTLSLPPLAREQAFPCGSHHYVLKYIAQVNVRKKLASAVDAAAAHLLFQPSRCCRVSLSVYDSLLFKLSFNFSTVFNIFVLKCALMIFTR